MKYFTLVTVFTLGILLSGCTYVYKNPTWITDQNGCKLWNPYPLPNEPETITWTGECVDGYIEGYGILKWYGSGKVKNKYIGNVSNHRYNGKGTVFYENGEKYIGEFKEGERHGQGTFYYVNEDIFVGKFEDGFQREGKFIHAWVTIEDTELYKLIAGNTLIAKSERYCSENSLKESCQKIAILSLDEEVRSAINKGKFDLGRHKATIIYPDKKKLIEGEWGYYSMNLVNMAIHTGIESIPTDSSQYPFKKIVFVNPEKNRIKIMAKDITIFISVQKGQNQQFIANAKNGNYKQLDYTKGKTLLGIAIEKVVESLENIGETSPSSNKKSYCFGTGMDNQTDRNICLATATKDKSYCFGTGMDNQTDRNMCLASATGNKSYCFGTGMDNQTDKNMCLATTTKDKSYCFGTGMDNQTDRNMCLASATGDKTYCFGTGMDNQTDKNMCLAQTK